MKNTLKVTTPSDREIMMTRVFDAPRSLVFEALTTPDLLERWLGVHDGWSLVVCEIDLKVGGAFRYVWRGPDGTDMGMRGVYREIVRPEYVVNTESFDEPWYPRAFARHRPGAAYARGLPALGQPMHEPGLNLLALAYRSIYAVVGSYIAAQLAPRNPMRHALALEGVGFVLSVAGAIATITMADLGPNWYPIALVLTAPAPPAARRTMSRSLTTRYRRRAKEVQHERHTQAWVDRTIHHSGVKFVWPPCSQAGCCSVLDR